MNPKKREPTRVEFTDDRRLRVVGTGIRHYLTLGLGFLTMLAVVALWALLNGSPGYEEPSEGNVAVCKDGTVLEPPWNSCGKEHGYLDHWTTGPVPSP